jgi:hypothetical protein
MIGNESARGRAPMYARLLRLRRLRIGGFASFLLVECTVAVAILLALAELVSWWAVLVLPSAVAAMVKINDLVGQPARTTSRVGRHGAGAEALGLLTDDDAFALNHARSDPRWDADWSTEQDIRRSSGSRGRIGAGPRFNGGGAEWRDAAMDAQDDYMPRRLRDTVDRDAHESAIPVNGRATLDTAARAEPSRVPRRVATSLPVGQPAVFGAAVRRSMAQAHRRAADTAGRHARNDSVGLADRSDRFNERRFGRSA